MALISSYPLLKPQLGDKVLGSNVVDTSGNTVTGNPTVQYNFTDVKALVNPVYSQSLSSFNSSPITPGNNNTGVAIVFGGASGLSTDDVMIDSAGKVTFNKIGSYVIQQIHYAQATSGNNIVLNFKTLQGTTQVGPTSTTSFLSNSSTARHRIDIISYVNITTLNTEYTFYIQNPTTGGIGSLQPQTIEDAWGTNVPSAQIIITKLK
tara:strand:+ start:463 stop:1083 length:621 start_codon:yes stop_codon:yes gene_type:complete